MKLADVQVLFYAIDSTSALHTPAARWLEDTINGREPVGLTWPTLHQFLRLGTSPVFQGRMTDREALRWIEDWLAAGVEIVSDSDLRWELLSELLAASQRSVRNAIDDAHLAAIAISRGATLATFDEDFRVFVAHGLRLERLSPEDASEPG